MAPGLMGRLGHRLHLKSSPKKVDAKGRAPTPNNASPLARSPIRKKASVARAAFTRAGHALRTPKKLEQLEQLELEPPVNTIFSFPARPQLDKYGKPACVRYIADYECGHEIIEQHPCEEHDPAFCLDDGHCVTAKMKKTKKCPICQMEEVAKLNESAHATFVKERSPFAPKFHPVNRRPGDSPQVKRALIKARIAKRIEELGPLGSSNPSLHSALNENEEARENVNDLGVSLQNLELGLDSQATNDDRSPHANIGQLAKARLNLESIVAVALARRGYPTAASRAVSDSRLLDAGRIGDRSVSESLRPLPPLPTPVDLDADGITDKAYAGAFQDVSPSVTIGSVEDTNGVHRKVYTTPKMPDDDDESFTFNEDDDYESTLHTHDDSAADRDPFMDGRHLEISLGAAHTTERPLPPLPSSIAERNSMHSSTEGEKKLIFSTKSLQYWVPGNQPGEQPSPTRARPALPSPSDPFAAFDFQLTYNRGKLGYIGRMGQKGSGDDFNRDWKIEHPTRDYSDDETATGDLWENKHGFGYAGLKRYLQKLNENKGKQEEKQGSPNKRYSEESFSYSSPRPNKQTSVWARRWVKNVGFPLPAPMLCSVDGDGKTDVASIVKMKNGDTQIIIKSAMEEKYKDIPWDRTMIGCAL